MSITLVCPMCGHQLVVGVPVKGATHAGCPKRQPRQPAPEYERRT